MKLFIDTAKVEDIKKANDMGVICGVTTNPSLIAKEGRVFEEVIAEIAQRRGKGNHSRRGGHDQRRTGDCEDPSQHGSQDSHDCRRAESM